jgi:hypothetical protein
MDLKLYYQKIRETEAKIAEPYPIVKSLETADGGKPGALTEVAKKVAAKMVVEGQAQLATKEEAVAFIEQNAEAKRMADQILAASKVQVAVVSADELTRLRNKSGAPAH